MGAVGYGMPSRDNKRRMGKIKRTHVSLKVSSFLCSKDDLEFLSVTPTS